jgi:hypothetical protein
LLQTIRSTNAACAGAFDLRDTITTIQYRQGSYRRALHAEDVVMQAQKVKRATKALGKPPDTVVTDPEAEADSLTI